MCLAAADLVATLAHFASPPEPERDHRDHQDNRDGADGPRRSPSRLGRLARQGVRRETGDGLLVSHVSRLMSHAPARVSRLTPPLASRVSRLTTDP